MIGYGVPSHDAAFLESICEETRTAMLYGNRFPNRQVALVESANIYENGELIDMNKQQTITEDYTKSYTTNLKKLSEMYRAEEGDKVSSMNLAETVIKNKSLNKTKKVLTEDYIVKDIRNNILNLGK